MLLCYQGHGLTGITVSLKTLSQLDSTSVLTEFEEKGRLPGHVLSPLPRAGDDFLGPRYLQVGNCRRRRRQGRVGGGAAKANTV